MAEAEEGLRGWTRRFLGFDPCWGMAWCVCCRITLVSITNRSFSGIGRKVSIAVTPTPGQDGLEC
jgi:hypothetical protein